MNLFIASDHAGFQLKKYLLTYIKTQLKQAVADLGPAEYKETDDYPLIASNLAKKVAADRDAKGILICGSGHGVCMVANKIKGVRGIVGYSIEAAEMGRKDEDANVLCLAGRLLSDDHAAAIVKKFLETDFTNQERHVRRLREIEEIEI